MKIIKCLIPNCGLEMKGRINGSHLKRKHNLTVNEYKLLYPDANLGEYIIGMFICKICNKEISNCSEIKNKHIMEHGFKSIDDYNIKHEKVFCLCGCNQLSDYSYVRHKYNDYKKGHHKVWNYGLSKENDKRIKLSNAGGWNKGLNKNNNDIMKSVSIKVIDFWNKNPNKKIQMVDNVKKTMLQKYDVENANDYPFFWAKYRDYVFPTGKIVRIQGYENLGLDFLLKEYTEENIIVDRKLLPKFYYQLNKKYTPDIHVLTNNTIYDIKSTWTYKIFKNKNEKIKSVLNAGFNFTILIFDNIGKIKIKEYKINDNKKSSRRSY